MSIVNRTPHSVTIIPADAPASAATGPSAVQVPAAERGEVARVQQSTRSVSRDDDPVSILAPGWGSVVGLGEPQEGVTQLVSVIVVLAAMAQGRTLADLAVPGDQVRDDRGRIVACRGITRGADAWPRVRWQRLPRVAIFGSAARWVRQATALRNDMFTRIAAGDPAARSQYEQAIRALPRPHDIDVAYIGMDAAAAAELVADWTQQGVGRELREICFRVPLDLHCQPGSEDQLVIPRPAGLVGESGEIPLDSAVVPVFGGADDIELQIVISLPSILRRAATLLSYEVPLDIVADMVVRSWPHRVDILVGDGGERQDCYDGSSTAAIRRALVKLGEHKEPLMRALAEHGLPVETVVTIATQRIAEPSLEAMRRGAPAVAGPTLRISRRNDSWMIGPVHCTPGFAVDHIAAAWLVDPSSLRLSDDLSRIEVAP